jgi:hypothetical protein
MHLIGITNNGINLETSTLRFKFPTATVITSFAKSNNYSSWTDNQLVTALQVKNAINEQNHTISHKTSIVNGDIGRFCEMNGNIYNETIGPSDCICCTTLATELTQKIVGIITEENKFASHGDVLVFVDDGEYNIGDLLVPTPTGARIANDDEKMFIMINGLPRVRVANTEIRNYQIKILIEEEEEEYSDNDGGTYVIKKPIYSYEPSDQKYIACFIA